MLNSLNSSSPAALFRGCVVAGIMFTVIAAITNGGKVGHALVTGAVFFVLFTAAMFGLTAYKKSHSGASPS